MSCRNCDPDLLNPGEMIPTDEDGYCLSCGAYAFSLADPKPGALIRMQQPEGTKKPCQHNRLVPFALVYVRKIYPNGFKEPPEYDYSATSLAATELHVKKFICLDCATIINTPNIYECKEE